MLTLLMTLTKYNFCLPSFHACTTSFTGSQNGKRNSLLQILPARNIAQLSILQGTLSTRVVHSHFIAPPYTSTLFEHPLATPPSRPLDGPSSPTDSRLGRAGNSSTLTFNRHLTFPLLRVPRGGGNRGTGGATPVYRFLRNVRLAFLSWHRGRVDF